MNFIELLRQSGIPPAASLNSDTPVPVGIIGWYAPRAATWDGVMWQHSPALLPYAEACFLAVDLADDGLMTGYLRVAHDQSTPQSSEAGEIHLDHFDTARGVFLDGVTFDDACGTNDLSDHEFGLWLDRHARR